MRTRYFIWLLSMLVAVAMGPGCGQLTPEFPEKQLYNFNDIELAPAETPCLPTPQALIIKPLDASQSWDRVSFVYRIASNTFTTDYINEFMLAPAALITEKLENVLYDASCFTPVADRPGAGPLLKLEGTVTRLFADIAKPDTPVAVLAIRFSLIRRTDNSNALLWTRTYSQTPTADSQAPGDLMAAWDRGLERILTQVYADILSSLPPPGP